MIIDESVYSMSIIWKGLDISVLSSGRDHGFGVG